MKNEITHIKTDVNEIKDMLTTHVEDEKTILQSLDTKYATIEKVNYLESKLVMWNKNQDKTLKSRGDFTKELILKFAPWIAVGTLWAFNTFGPGGP